MVKLPNFILSGFPSFCSLVSYGSGVLKPFPDEESSSHRHGVTAVGGEAASPATSVSPMLASAFLLFGSPRVMADLTET